MLEDQWIVVTPIAFVKRYKLDAWNVPSAPLIPGLYAYNAYQCVIVLVLTVRVAFRLTVYGKWKQSHVVHRHMFDWMAHSLTGEEAKGIHTETVHHIVWPPLLPMGVLFSLWPWSSMATSIFRIHVSEWYTHSQHKYNDTLVCITRIQTWDEWCIPHLNMQMEHFNGKSYLKTKNCIGSVHMRCLSLPVNIWSSGHWKPPSEHASHTAACTVVNIWISYFTRHYIVTRKLNLAFQSHLSLKSLQKSRNSKHI